MAGKKLFTGGDFSNPIYFIKIKISYSHDKNYSTSLA